MVQRKFSIEAIVSLLKDNHHYVQTIITKFMYLANSAISKLFNSLHYKLFSRVMGIRIENTALFEPGNL